ncbi:hypothetical protein PsYK624_037360 [Phanerochaete sordida]|uniref:Pal1-domain-containing protein n=1 Tax=Phanerochaete sordida TaxID=48140 RepID=A0A9P3G3M3_9APHY|nr:hypothetical protein PsYK624_037360 [Phanerochaete sordida]
MALSKQPHRHRSSSDPFSDPPAIAYSSYGVPTLSRNAPPQTDSRAPPVPPKIPAKPSANTRSRPKQTMASEITTVPRQSGESPRNRMGRSNTQLPPPPPTKHTAPTTRRSLSQDSVLRAAQTVEKAKVKRTIPTKKGSSHADVIDRLDFSGVGPMFHHDGPFDACAPSRNKHRTRAPMLAWTSATDEDKDALANAREIPASHQAPYPSPGIYAPYEPPKKKHDAIAEAWGIHEPEPYEDFSAGGGYAGGGHSEFAFPGSRHGASTARRTKDREVRDKHLDDATPKRQATKRSPIPPPQPIFVPEGEGDVSGGAVPSSPSGPSSPGAPKRSKSLMHRIRKMRDNPMVPPLSDDYPIERDPSPPTSSENFSASQPQRPTHRSQNSFLGRFGGRPSKDLPSPEEEAFVYVEEPAPGRREKSLPRPPTSPNDSGQDGYFDQSYGGGAGLGRKTSLLKKVKGVVKGNGAVNK